jgi:hypothetical protein
MTCWLYPFQHGTEKNKQKTQEKVNPIDKGQNDPSRKTFRGDCSETSSLESRGGMLSKLKWRHPCQTSSKIKPRRFLYVCGYPALKPF